MRRVTTDEAMAGGGEFEYGLLGMEEAVGLVGRADEVFREWRGTGFGERAVLMGRLAEVVAERVEEGAVLMAREMGKPVVQGRAEMEKCAWVCRFYAEAAAGFLADEEVVTVAGKRNFISYRPLGVILAVMPWNFPFWQVFRFVAPNLMAGNVGMLKHAPNVPRCAEMIEGMVREAGFPEGVFTNLFVDHDQFGELVGHAAVRGVTLTGSTRAGRAVAARAGACLKKAVLELGGSDPYVVLEDADVERAAETCVTARMINGGQTCVAAKRFIVVEAVREKFTRLVVEKMEAIRMGDPMAEETQLGPMAREDLREALDGQVRRSIGAGANCLLGGEVPEGEEFSGAAYYPATVLDGVKPGMAAFDEEVFGPVAAIVPAAEGAEAIRLANETPYGLGAAVFTRDVAEGERIAREELEAGSCVVNDFVVSDPRLPFGGIKESGYGRELAGEGIREFVNVKVVTVRK